MKRIKEFFASLAGFPGTELDILHDRVESLEKELGIIKGYLTDIAAFATYVREKEEKRDEVFAVLTAAQVDLTKKSNEELAEDLMALDDLYLSVESGQAIGRQEIESKNYNMTKIEAQRSAIRQQLAKA
jgi:hypothetical protein